MNAIQGPRTSPTVHRHPASQARISASPWRLSLGAPQITLTLAVVTGSIAAGYFLGFNAGQNIGFQSAQSQAVASVARLPIAADQINIQDQDIDNESNIDVYAKLATTGPLMADYVQPRSDEIAPPVAAIRSIEQAPVGDALPANETFAETITLERDSTQRKPSFNGEESSSSLAKADSKIEVRTLGDLTKDSSMGGVKTTVTAPLVSQELGKTGGTMIDSGLGQKREPALSVVDPAKLATNKTAPEVKKVVAETRKPVVTLVEKTAPKIEAASVSKKTVDVASAISKGWYAQIAAPSKVNDAQALAAKVKSSGFSVKIEHAEVRGEMYFRVLVGPEDTRPLVERLVAQLKREPYLTGSPFVRFVK